MGRIVARGGLALCITLLLLTAAPVIPSAQGQTAPAVTLRLLAESTWTGPTRPLVLAFSATNESTVAVGTLSVVLSIWAPTRSRSAYELSLKEDATTVLLSQPFPQSGSLLPGQTRTFALRQHLDLLHATDNALYPIKAQLLSADVPVATLRTPMIFLIETPQVPLNLTWTWVLSDPMQLEPDGSFGPGPIEPDIAPGGRLDLMTRALEGLRTDAVDVVVSSVLLDELRKMTAGYRIVDSSGAARTVAQGTGGAADAERILSGLGRIVARPQTELVGMPLGDPSEPALIRAGLSADIPTLAAEGASAIAAALHAQPVDHLARPIASALNGPSLVRLVRSGTDTVLLDANFMPSPAGLHETASPIVQLASGSTELTGVLPDPGVAAVATTYQADPVLDAHATLGALAAIWLELPGTAGRGAAILFPEQPQLPSAFFGPFAALVGGSPWLMPVPASGLAALVGTPERQAVPNRLGATFPTDYLARLRDARASWGHFADTAVGATTLVETLRQRLLLAEGSTFMTAPASGDRYVSSVLDAVHAAYGAIRISTTQVTLTSRSGVLPLTLTNATGYAVKVVLRFVSDRRLVFEQGDSYPVLLTGSSRTLTFRVRAETTGRFPITVDLETPSGASTPDTIAQTVMVVRSTAYNKVALVVTIGAALFLAAWWGRRFLPRKSH